MAPVLSLVILGPQWSGSLAHVPGLGQGFCWEQPQAGPQAQQQEMSHVGQARDISILHPTMGCPCLTPSLCPGLHHPPWLPGCAGLELAKKMRHVGDGRDEEEGVIFPALCFKPSCN